MNYYAMVDIKLQEKENRDSNKVWNKDMRKTQLIKNICNYYNVTIDDLKVRNRKGNIRDSRNLTMYCLHKVLMFTSQGEGDILNRDHATILNGCRRTMDWIETDKEYQQLVSTIINR